ncbi:MAG TPA: FGGY-family carbohydrate kinase [Vicinamibacterales bacterium]|nr:FGGY-family carbohydrate kinase [Vicinamibacterales bacterium]
MSAAPRFLAIDLGAESGRAVIGELADGVLRIQEIHRFPNRVVRLGGSLHWDVYALWEEVREAVRRAAAAGDLASIGIDTWGVDFALLAADGTLLGLPHTYRDPRTEGAIASATRVLPLDDLYRRTGIQALAFNTLFQLHAMARHGSPLPNLASDLLFVPDLFHFWLSGRKATEFTFATTSQLYNPTIGGWDETLLALAGVRPSLMQDVVPPGTRLGSLTRAVADQTGCAAPLIAVGTHDTASAVAAVPADDPRFAYISSGTWSLVGAEVATPFLTEAASRAGFTNEGGVNGTFRLLRNVAGLWLLQECRRRWGIEPQAYAALTAAASEAEPFAALIDPDDPGFFNPPDMVGAIERRLAATGQRAPATRGGFVRCILESLALKSRQVLDALAIVRGQRATVVHIVGGGSKNPLLCQLTADATGLPVVAGPAEATAIGNLLVQAVAAGAIASLDEGRAVVARSFEPARYLPRAEESWNRAYDRFVEMAQG